MKKILIHSFYLIIFIGILSAVFVATVPEKSNSFNETKMADSANSEQYRKDVMAEHERGINQKVSKELNDIYLSLHANLLVIEQSIINHGACSKEVHRLIESKNNQDSLDLIKVEQIINKYGWLGPERIGAQNSYTLFTVIQNADYDTQEKYIPLMMKAVKSGSLAPRIFADLIDRKALVQHGKQVFGTIFSPNFSSGQYSFAPIADEALVNQRRLEIGLEPIEEYAKSFNLKHPLLKKES
ncbi:MAG: hypothetical protein JWO32_261 [Bacteroidetes bacterium]|nr:hypothetical protein [Bacteroidota bacterium]